jgi:hypothetical protein
VRAKAAILLVAGLATACTQPAPTTQTQSSSRWIDRKIYFANPDPSDSTRNNIFEAQLVQEALTSIESATMFGDGYFSYANVDESTLPINLAAGQYSNSQVSFILIWPDAVFNAYVANTLNSTTPDPNAVAIINDADKHEFFIILKSSCFSTNASCNNIGTNGLDAMIARQLGLIMGLTLKDCTLYPSDVMCADKPTDAQWSQSSQLSFSAALNNVLEVILNTPGFYPF